MSTVLPGYDPNQWNQYNAILANPSAAAASAVGAPMMSGMQDGLTSVAGVAGAGGVSGFQPNWMQKMTGWTDPTTGYQNGGWGGFALNAAQTGIGAWMGLQQLNTAKDQLAFQKDAFKKNYAAQRQTMNTQLQDRQAARIAANPNAGFQPVPDYMKDNGIR